MTTSSKSTTLIADTTARLSAATARRNHSSKTASASVAISGLTISSMSNPAAASDLSRSITDA